MWVVPLRIPVPCDLKGELVAWLDAAHASQDQTSQQQQQQQQQQQEGPSPSESPPTVPKFRSFEIMDDLARLDELRGLICRTLTGPSAHDKVVPIIPQLHEYHACLLAFEARGFPTTATTMTTTTTITTPNSEPISNQTKQNSSQQEAQLQLGWKSAFVLQQQNQQQPEDSDSICFYDSTLAWERANVLWNLAAIESYQAFSLDPKDKPQLTKAVKLWQNSASYMMHLSRQLVPPKTDHTNSSRNINGNSQSHSHIGSGSSSSSSSTMAMPIPTTTMPHHRPPASGIVEGGGSPSPSSPFPGGMMDFSAPMIYFWAKVLQAQAQMIGHALASMNPRMNNLLLAKLAQAAVPYLEDALAASRQLLDNILQQQRASDDSHEGGDRRQQHQHQQRQRQHYQTLHNYASHWSVHLQTWSLIMSSKAEHHDSITSREKSKWGMELARLKSALRKAQACEELLNRSLQTASAPTSEEFSMQFSQQRAQIEGVVSELLERLNVRYTQAHHEFRTMNNADGMGTMIPHDMREIRGQVLAKDLPSPLPPAMMQLTTPLFANLLSPRARHACGTFRRDMDTLVAQMARMVEEKSGTARQQLAAVQLPHSFTAYKQNQAGGGIPVELWERVRVLQEEGRIDQVKKDLWELRDVAEQAQTLFSRTAHQLEEDISMDRAFRRDHPNFDGHNVKDVQRPFRSSLSDFKKFLTKSQEGDAVLLKRLEILDRDPKYKLLTFHKTQLDRLLPGHTAGSGNPNSPPPPAVETQTLSQLLAELFTLLRERDVNLARLRDEVRLYDIASQVKVIDAEGLNAERDYHQAIKTAQTSFSGMVFNIQQNIDRQANLLEEILIEQERFVTARDAAEQHHQQQSAALSSAASESCIAMIEDAMDEIQQLDKHLKEGRKFYDFVIPRLEALKQQVGDASVRLAVERYDFEEGRGGDADGSNSGADPGLSYRNHQERQRQEMEDARMAASLADLNTDDLPSMTTEMQQPSRRQERLSSASGLTSTIVSTSAATPAHVVAQQHQHQHSSVTSSPIMRQAGSPSFLSSSSLDHHHSFGSSSASLGVALPSNESHEQYEQPQQRTTRRHSSHSIPVAPPATMQHPQNRLQPQQQPQQQSHHPNHHPRPPPQPGVVNVPHDEPQVRVDDELVAILVGMEFDPERAVEALRKYDNNWEQALNDLVG